MNFFFRTEPVKSLKKTILKNLVLIGIVPLLTTLVVAYTYTVRDTRRVYEDGINTELKRCSSNIDSKMLTFLNFTDYLVSNTYILQNLNRDFNGDITDIMQFNYMLDLFCGGQVGQSGASVIIFTSNQSLPQSKYIQSIDKLKDIPQAMQLMQLNHPQVVWQPEVRQDRDIGEYVAIYRNIFRISKPIGVLAIRIPLEQLRGYVGTIDLQEDTTIAYVAGNKKNYIYGDIESGSAFSTELVNGATVTLYAEGPKWISNSVGVVLLVFIGFIISFLLIYYMSAIIAKRTSSGLEKFVDGLSFGDSVTIDKDEIYEIAIIKRKFIDLLDTVERTYKDANEIRHSRALLEVELLQQRLNPHMLYNSLSVIQWCAKRNGDERAQDLINKLITYYRGALNKGNAVITVEKELELIKDYVDIHCLSYDCCIEFLVTSSPEAAACSILKMLLQPIVENALMHGLKGRKTGIINVSSEVIKDELVLTVYDNGRGMKQDKAEALMNGEDAGYGISNTIQRIKLYYGEQYGIKIISMPQEGTSVTITLPVLYQDELNIKIDTH